MEERLQKLEKQVKNLITSTSLYLPIIMGIIMVSSLFFGGSFKKSYDVCSTTHYNGATMVTRPVRQYHINVTPTTGNNGSYSIASLGLSTILDVQATILRNTSTVGDAPAISLKTISTSAITYNIVQANPAVVSILSINVLSGNPQAYPTTLSDITIKFVITGY